jgi:hypothetical protein
LLDLPVTSDAGAFWDCDNQEGDPLPDGRGSERSVNPNGRFMKGRGK